MAGPDTDDKDAWERVKTLGTGGFGTVTLWVNKEFNQKIAVKTCRVVAEMSSKHKERWKKEVEIMLRLTHPNVVHALTIPAALEEQGQELPPLAMEYCAGGDLRKVLNKAENCCGLPEYKVRRILNDVADGMEYLHSHRIIHRDLKPENIVLQNVESDDIKIGSKTVYKIIDLGYAKDLDQGSLCTSFVGTPQYLAPELLESQPKYSCTVDYWSFGILGFEIITGFRPFLPNKSPFQWHEPVRNKGDNIINVFYNNRGEIEYSMHLPTPNHLCRTTEKSIEQWLRIMLLWNPKERGGGMLDSRPKCFPMLEQLLNVKMVFVFCVYTNQLLSYPVKEKHTMADLQLVLETETKVPVSQQELLLATGVSPDSTKPALQCSTVMGEEEWLVFLFKKESTEFPTKLLKRYLPDTVQSMIRDPKALLTYQDQKKVWSHAVYFCQETAQAYKRLTHAQRAAVMALLRSNKPFSTMKARVSEEMVKLTAQIDFYKQSLNFDLSKLEAHKSSGDIGFMKLQSSWRKMEEKSSQLLDLREEVKILDSESQALSTKIMELQRSPFAKTKQLVKLDEICDQALQLYTELKHLAKEQRHTQQLDNRRMITCLKSCINEREGQTKELYAHLSKIQSCRCDLQKLMPRLENLLQRIRTSQHHLLELQEIRQADLWSLVINPPLDKLSTSVMENSVDASSYLEKSMEESLLIINENQETKSRLDTMIQSIHEEFPDENNTVQSLDWNFLDPPNGNY